MADIAYKGDTLVECQGTTSAGIDFRWVMLRLTILSSPCEGSLLGTHDSLRLRVLLRSQVEHHGIQVRQHRDEHAVVALHPHCRVVACCIMFCCLDHALAIMHDILSVLAVPLLTRCSLQCIASVVGWNKRLHVFSAGGNLTCFKGRLISRACVLALSCCAMDSELCATAHAFTAMDANTPSVSSANSRAAVASASMSMLSLEPPKSRPAGTNSSLWIVY
jgi:hypothetical protein